jgi:hypothetical protein
MRALTKRSRPDDRRGLGDGPDVIAHTEREGALPVIATMQVDQCGTGLVHDLDNPVSCRVAAKSGYPFERLNPANPPLWFTDGHIHVADAPTWPTSI